MTGHTGHRDILRHVFAWPVTKTNGPAQHQHNINTASASATATASTAEAEATAREKIRTLLRYRSLVLTLSCPSLPFSCDV
ncbi:hypothetical protein M0802_010193 [Mischocyttarus mexicanus]|nr:hypothetical protein M0802_010193 [Mischocyttarus mexicanus]